MVGHIKLDRKILLWEWYQDANTCRLFIHLLLTANWQEGKWQGYAVGRGQLITGLKKLSAATGLSIMQLRTSFDKLKSTNEITVVVTNKFRVITICKYDTYQSLRNEDNKQNSTQTATFLTSQQQTSNKQVTTNNNNKNNKEDNTEPEKINFSMAEIYYKSWVDYKNILNGMSKHLTEDVFNQWKDFVCFVNENQFEELLKSKFITPIDFGKLIKENEFPKEKWGSILKKILSTGIKPEHNLYFRIPEFIAYSNKFKKETIENVQPKIKL